MSNSHFKRTGLSVEEQIGRVKRPFAVTTGCSARFSAHFRAVASARVAARGQAGGLAQARVSPASHTDARRRFWLPAETLVELEGRGALEQRISGGIVLVVGGLPQRRAAGGRDAGRRGGFTPMAEDVAHSRAVGDEGDDPYRGAAAGANQRKNLMELLQPPRYGRHPHRGFLFHASVRRRSGATLGDPRVKPRLHARHLPRAATRSRPQGRRERAISTFLPELRAPDCADALNVGALKENVRDLRDHGCFVCHFAAASLLSAWRGGGPTVEPSLRTPSGVCP